MKMKTIFAVMATAALLVGCAGHSPETISLNPEQPQVEPKTSTMVPLSLAISDVRTVNYVVRYDNDDKPARLVGLTQTPNALFEQLFRQALGNAGYQIDPASGTTVQIKLEQLLTDVDESMLGFEAVTNLAIGVDASNSHQTFSKRYSATSRLKGPFSADFATLELDINKLITQLAGQILADPELNNFLQQP